MAESERKRMSLDEPEGKPGAKPAKGGAGLDRFKAIKLVVALVMLSIGGYLVVSQFMDDSPATTPAAPETVVAGGASPASPAGSRPATTSGAGTTAAAATPADPAAEKPKELRRVGGRIVPSDSPERPR